jgi:hypothetical protein
MQDACPHCGAATARSSPRDRLVIFAWGDPMQLDPEYLRQHYDSLSDEALLAVDRNELVEMAQKILDEEVARRDLAPRRVTRRTHAPQSIPMQPDPTDVGAELDGGPVMHADLSSQPAPHWIPSVYPAAITSSIAAGVNFSSLRAASKSTRTVCPSCTSPLSISRPSGVSMCF